jgi:hypothetical protein
LAARARGAGAGFRLFARAFGLGRAARAFLTVRFGAARFFAPARLVFRAAARAEAGVRFFFPAALVVRLAACFFAIAV